MNKQITKKKDKIVYSPWRVSKKKGILNGKNADHDVVVKERTETKIKYVYDPKIQQYKEVKETKIRRKQKHKIKKLK